MTWSDGNDQETLVMKQIINLLWEKSSNLEAIQHTYDDDNLIMTQRLRSLEDKFELLLSEVDLIRDTLKEIQPMQPNLHEKENFPISNSVASTNSSMLKTRHSLPSQLIRQSEIDVTFDAASPTSPGLSASLQDVLGELKFLDENDISSTCSVETKDEILRNLSYDTSVYNESTQISSSDNDMPPDIIRIDQSQLMDMRGVDPPELLREFHDPPELFRDHDEGTNQCTEHDAQQALGDSRSNTRVIHEINQDIFELTLTSDHDNIINILTSTPKEPQVFNIPSSQSEKRRSFVVENVICKLPVVIKNRAKMVESDDSLSFCVNNYKISDHFSTPEMVNIDRKENRSSQLPPCDKDIENNVRVKCQITIEDEEIKCETFQPVTQPIKSAFELHDWTRSDTFDVISDNSYSLQEGGREKDRGSEKRKPPSKPERTQHIRPRPERGVNEEIRRRKEDEMRKKEEERRKHISSFCQTDSTEPMSEHSTFSVCSSMYSSTGLDYEVQYIQPQVSEEEEEEGEEEEEEEEGGEEEEGEEQKEGIYPDQRPETVLKMPIDNEGVEMCLDGLRSSLYEPEPVHLIHHEDDVISPTKLCTIHNTVCMSHDLSPQTNHMKDESVLLRHDEHYDTTSAERQDERPSILFSQDRDTGITCKTEEITDTVNEFTEDASSEHTSTPVNSPSGTMSCGFDKEQCSGSVFMEEALTHQNNELSAGCDVDEEVSSGSVDEVFQMKSRTVRGSSKSVDDYFRGLVNDKLKGDTSRSEKSECETSAYSSSSEVEDSHEENFQEERLLTFSSRRKSEC